MAPSTHTNQLKRSFEEMESKPSNTETVQKLEDFAPRSYQKKIFEVARKKNTIAVLATGSGKTMIAVMLIQEIGEQLKSSTSSEEKKLIVFLAPTVNLVLQQFEVIKLQTNFKVKQYYGALGVDEWDLNRWSNEVKENDVMVMTPQILLDALRNAFLSINVICLMVFDECHRATGKHPYTKIMKEFYHKSAKKPKIFGMTASPVVRKGVSSAGDCEDQMATLESLLDSKIYTVDGRAELEIFAPSATEVKRYYDPNSFLHEELKKKLESSWSKFDGLLADQQNSVASQYKDTTETFAALRRKLLSYHGKILHCLDGLGFLCAHEAAKVCAENARVSVTTEECELYKTSFVQCRCFLDELLQTFEESLPQDYERFFSIEIDHITATQKGYISPKLFELIQIFHSFGRSKEVLCLIFVDRIIAAKVIQRFMKKLSYLSHFTGSYLTGGGASVDALTPNMQKKTLESFRCGEVNLLFTTDVAEEGIHVANCSYVIRFDLPRSVRSYIQSRGRARQDGSQYILMLERGNIEQRNMLFDIIRGEQSMAHSTINRDPDAGISEVSLPEEPNIYVVESTGALITADCSINLIYKFCEKLPGDMYFTPKPKFEITSSGGLFKCELTLPASSVLQRIVGPEAKNMNLAKQLVCLEACKELHELGALDNHLNPILEKPLEAEGIKSVKDYSSGAGTTKRKELHGTTTVRALSGSWGGKIDGISLHSYIIDFHCNQVGEFYRRFILLIETKLDVDVAKAEVELFLIGDKLVKSSISPCGEIYLNAIQVKIARSFQELFFNGLFGKLYIGSKKSKVQRQFLLNDEHKSLWSSSNMYMLLPVSSTRIVEVDWRAVNACASAVEYVRRHFSVFGENLPRKNHEEGRQMSSSAVCLANTYVEIDKLKDMVVLAIHTGKIYSVLEARIEMSAESSFDGEFDVVPSTYSSFKAYFKEKYGIVLQYPGQPLLRLKHSHNPHNLLARPKKEGGMATEKALAFVHMPAELLVPIDVEIDVLKSFYLFPSLMHRLESLMLAIQLREEISCDLNNCHISSSLILEALTSLRCCEDFSLERLELLGDSVLKYAVSCTLFLKHPNKHEGQLSASRSHAVCNSTLHKLGTNRKLQGYIRDSAFDPRRWVAPGQYPIRPTPCQCGVDTADVPLESEFVTEDIKVVTGNEGIKIVMGKSCDRGHRWMCSKTISDCAEALIGAFYVGGGLTAALMFMKWLGINAEFEPGLIESAIFNASLRCCTLEAGVLQMLEAKLDYKFAIKGLLLEAITHGSQQENGVGFCYQRLEFLGDSALDLLITRHLFQNHIDIDPGELTDLRSASVNNENFAKVAVRHDLQQHLLHCSGLLVEQIAEYKFFLSGLHQSPFQKAKCPKALGDLVESVAGAILIDTRLNLDEVWRIFEPLLSPIVTPENLELPPFRELNELCSHHGYFIKETCIKKEETVHVELWLQLKDALLKGQGFDKRKKAAKGQAALHLLKDLEERGISHSRHVFRNNVEMEVVDYSIDVCEQANGKDFITPASKKKKTTGDPFPVSSSHPVVTEDLKSLTAVEVTINKKKGAPRSSLYDLCKRMQWPMPSLQWIEKRSRSPVQIGCGPESNTGFNLFVSKINLHIPNFGAIEQTGEERLDKKSSQDSAALAMLYELGRLGKCTIKVL